jgi:hypothetical protein
VKRSLRPRKIENYRQMIEGDETTLKSIMEERNEMKQKQGASSESSDDFDDIAVQMYPLTEALRGKSHFNNDSDNDEAFGK